jgi:hypothetical protein
MTSTLDLHIRKSIFQIFIDSSKPATIARLQKSPDFEKLSEAEIAAALDRLDKSHHICLRKGTHDILVAHPFSANPTPFIVSCGSRKWWGYCAWDSLAIAAILLHPNQKTPTHPIAIETRSGAIGENLVLEVSPMGELSRHDLVVHFSVPPRSWWIDVHYTCATILLFHENDDIHAWTEERGIQFGSVVPIDTMWTLAQRWYGNKAELDYKRLSRDEVMHLFKELGLAGEFWVVSDDWT